MIKELIGLGRAAVHLRGIDRSLARIADTLDRFMIEAGGSPNTYRTFHADNDPASEASYSASTDEDLHAFHEQLKKAQSGGESLSWEDLAEQMHQVEELAARTRQADRDE